MNRQLVAYAQIDTAIALNDAAFADYNVAMGRTPGQSGWIHMAVEKGDAWFLIDEAPKGLIAMRASDTSLWLDSIGIPPAHQGSGCGTKALSLIDEHAAQIGCTEIKLHTGQQFTHLVAFYSRAGFRVTGLGPHPKGRDDRLRVFMTKSLI